MTATTWALAAAGEFVAFLEGIGDDVRLPLARLIYQRLRIPSCYVTLLGETSTGKTSLINGILGEPLLPVSAGPTTSAVVQVILGDFPANRFLAIYREATQEDLDYDRFCDLCRHSAGQPGILRLQARLQAKDPAHDGLNLFDTPGYNSIVLQHDEVLREFLPESDLIVLVTTYRTGIGQADQDLFEAAQSSIDGLGDVPILLAINRSPAGSTIKDRRVQEILRNVEDCFRRTPELVLVETASQAGFQRVGSGGHLLPHVDALWNRVEEIAHSPDRIKAATDKIVSLLVDLIDDLDESLTLRELLLSDSDEKAARDSEYIEILRANQRQAQDAVLEFSARLKTLLSGTLRDRLDAMKRLVSEEVKGSGKWLDKDECLTWITHHVLPTQASQLARHLETILLLEVERLDSELQGIANTAIKKISDRMKSKNNASADFAAKLTQRAARRLAGEGLDALLLRFGGVGGEAAGMGNLAKMMVKRAGDLVGTTFDREVYDQIGRNVTKELIERLNVLFLALIEVTLYLLDVKTWQNKFIDQTSERLDEWGAKAHSDFNEQCDEIVRRNRVAVSSHYGSMIKECEDSLKLSEGDIEKARASLLWQREELRRIKQLLKGQTNCIKGDSP